MKDLEQSIVRRRAQLDQVGASCDESLSRLSFDELTRLVGKWDADLDRAEKHRFITVGSSEYLLLVKCAVLVIGRYSLDRAEAIVSEVHDGE